MKVHNYQQDMIGVLNISKLVIDKVVLIFWYADEWYPVPKIMNEIMEFSDLGH